MSKTVEVGKNIYVGIDKDDIVDGHPWSVIGDIRRPRSGYNDDANYECGDAMRAQFPNIDVDCETSCFYAYVKTEAEVQPLIEAIEAWLVAHPYTGPVDSED